MSQLSFSSFDSSLLVRDAQGRYLPASVDQILDAARQAIDQKMQRGTSFTSPPLVQECVVPELSGGEQAVVAVLLLDTQHGVVQYGAWFRGTLGRASVYPREGVNQALGLNAAAAISSHKHPAGNPAPSRADDAITG